jgi:plasmid stabilization system protein ParE
MSRPVVIRPEADREIESAVHGLEVARANAGRRFSQLVQELLQRIEQFPEIYAKAHREVRAAPIRKFHYVLFYRVARDFIEVIALVHGSRDVTQLFERFES